MGYGFLMISTSQKNECLDACDDYCAQMKKDINVTGSWNNDDINPPRSSI